MEPIFTDHRWGIFFGVLILFFSVTGILGYVPQNLVSNTWFLVIFILGVVLSGLLIEVGVSPYFIPNNKVAKKLVKRRRRR